MKIKCSYCGSYFNDTMEHCPQCGAPSEGVKRTTSTQPQTIAELAQWYQDRGLPPYEKTRFFIGENYAGARAFGIYKDEKSGNFVVYKNKDSGQRAIRYEGTDEAYAVNELFQRLKEEIIQQKNHNVNKDGRGISGHRKAASHKRRKSNGKKRLKLGCLSIIGIIFAVIFLVAGVIIAVDSPKTGYYKYDNTYMYFTDWTDDISEDGWIIYDGDTDKWSDVKDIKTGPEELWKNKTAKKYFLGEVWKKRYGCPDFFESEEYQDLIHNYAINDGYYKYGETTYYHDDLFRDKGWYEYYEDDWHPVSISGIPEELTHYSSAGDFYYLPDWDNETQLTDFTDTDYYEENHTYSDSDNDSWGNSNDDDSYNWDSDWDWDSGGSDWDSDW